MSKKDFNFAVKFLGESAAKNLKAKVDKLETQIATSGSPTPAIIKEARELAGSPKGLDIDTFFIKHRLINVDIEQLLHAPLKEDGTYA